MSNLEQIVLMAQSANNTVSVVSQALSTNLSAPFSGKYPDAPPQTADDPIGTSLTYAEWQALLAQLRLARHQMEFIEKNAAAVHERACNDSMFLMSALDLAVAYREAYAVDADEGAESKLRHAQRQLSDFCASHDGFEHAVRDLNLGAYF